MCAQPTNLSRWRRGVSTRPVGRLGHAKLAVFFDLRGLAMKCRKRSSSVLFVLFAALPLVVSMGALNARDADSASLSFAAAQTAKQQCRNTCRARYRDCLSLKQIPSSECRGVYQDCTRYTCNAVKG
jgi:hypothetical protein